MSSEMEKIKKKIDELEETVKKHTSLGTCGQKKA